jgi:lysophospholipase L1-like esterase
MSILAERPPHPSARLSSRAKLIWCLLAPLLAAGMLEFVVVALDVAPPRAKTLQVWNARQDDQLDDPEGQYRFHPRWLWEPRPGAEIDGDPINADCFRGPAVPREPRPQLRIATLGESVTFGMGVRAEESWPKVLERELRARGLDAEVLNFGVVGHTIAQGRELYLDRIVQWRPHVLIACYVAINESANAPNGLIDAVKMQLVGTRDFRLRMFLDRFASLRWLASLTGNTLAPGEVVYGLPRGQVPRVSVPHFAQMIARLQEETRANDCEFVLVSPPRTAQGETQQPAVLDYTAQVEKSASELAISLVDARGAFLAQGDDAARAKLFWDQWHLNAEGHVLCARAVADALQRTGVLERAAKQP